MITYAEDETPGSVRLIDGWASGGAKDQTTLLRLSAAREGRGSGAVRAGFAEDFMPRRLTVEEAKVAVKAWG